jgi:PAS domain S-box-containing protein
MPEPYSSQHNAYLAQYKETGSKNLIGITRELTARRKNGEIFPIELSVTEVVLGERIFFSGFVRDISVRKETENQLALEKTRFQSVIGNMPLGNQL